MNPILVIAKNTFREAIRDKVLYGILGFSFLYIAFTVLLAKLSLGEVVLLKSFGLAGIYIFGSIIAIFLGASIIYKEIERRTLYFVLSKPVSRLHVILGKFFGLFSAIIVTTILMTAVYILVIFYGGGGLDYLGLLATFFQLLETGLMVAILVFFSTISTPLTSTIAGTMVLFAGHSFGSVLRTAEQIGGPLYRFVQAVYYLFPNLEKFNIRNTVVHGTVPSLDSILLVVAYAVVYSGLMLYLANVFLKRKEL